MIKWEYSLGRNDTPSPALPSLALSSNVLCLINGRQHSVWKWSSACLFTDKKSAGVLRRKHSCFIHLDIPGPLFLFLGHCMSSLDYFLDFACFPFDVAYRCTGIFTVNYYLPSLPCSRSESVERTGQFQKWAFGTSYLPIFFLMVPSILNL